MKNTKQNSDWLIGVEAALRRAAINAKKLAELHGTPFVVNNDTNTLPKKLKNSKNG